MFSDSRTSPPDPQRVLRNALELAQEAVQFDNSKDPHNAVLAYGESIALLEHVLELLRDEDCTLKGYRTSESSDTSRDTLDESRRVKTIVSLQRVNLHVHIESTF